MSLSESRDKIRFSVQKDQSNAAVKVNSQHTDIIFDLITVIQNMISLIAASFQASIILNNDSLTQFG